MGAFEKEIGWLAMGVNSGDACLVIDFFLLGDGELSGTFLAAERYCQRCFARTQPVECYSEKTTNELPRLKIRPLLFKTGGGECT